VSPTHRSPHPAQSRHGVFVGPETLGRLVASATPSGYEVTQEQRGEHEFGSGGTLETRVRLLKEGEVILESFRLMTYDSSFDDSCDYGRSAVSATRVLVDDPVARAAVCAAERGPVPGPSPDPFVPRRPPP
jgi:hypothetical protein